MLKHFTILGAALIFTISGCFAQLPYSKMLDLTSSELKEKKFKYDKNKNRHTMSKANKTNTTMNVLSAVGGQSADIKPHQEDYTVTVQKGIDDKTSMISVLFHDDNAYHSIAEWITSNGITPIETNSGKVNIVKFDYENYTIELITEVVSVTSTTTRTFAAAKSIDESYNKYMFNIFTDVPPASKWHTKEAEKKAKKKAKGDKEDINDLM